MQGEAIPREVALGICEEIRSEKAHRIFSQCWGCVRFSGGDSSKMCVSSRPDFRGCGLVNDRFEQRSARTEAVRDQVTPRSSW